MIKNPCTDMIFGKNLVELHWKLKTWFEMHFQSFVGLELQDHPQTTPKELT